MKTTGAMQIRKIIDLINEEEHSIGDGSASDCYSFEERRQIYKNYLKNEDTCDFDNCAAMLDVLPQHLMEIIDEFQNQPKLIDEDSQSDFNKLSSLEIRWERIKSALAQLDMQMDKFVQEAKMTKGSDHQGNRWDYIADRISTAQNIIGEVL